MTEMYPRSTWKYDLISFYNEPQGFQRTLITINLEEIDENKDWRKSIETRALMTSFQFTLCQRQNKKQQLVNYHSAHYKNYS